MNKFILLFCYMMFFFVPQAESKTVKIAVIDTGYSHNLPDLKVCPKGEVDFTGEGMTDVIGHGTNILGIIAKELKDIDYCVYIFKIYGDPRHNVAIVNTLYSLIIASYIKDLNIINYSSTGNEDSEIEDTVIKFLITKRNIKFVAAAGNDAMDLDKHCNAFPACTPGVISVGNIEDDGRIQKHSNYGKCIKAWEKGVNLCVLNKCYSGTSMSAAVHSSRLAKELSKSK